MFRLVGGWVSGTTAPAEEDHLVAVECLGSDGFGIVYFICVVSGMIVLCCVVCCVVLGKLL